MSNSNLVSYTKLSPNFNPRGDTPIKKITIHHMAGNLSIETCGSIFANKSRQASSNYGVGTDGRIGMYVEECNRSWCSSSRDNDYQAVTIEVANIKGAPNWEVSDLALANTIALCYDICLRNNISKLEYTGDSKGNLTRHNMFNATTCPGPYLQSKFQYIADEVNKRLNKIQPEIVTTNNEMLYYRAHIQDVGDLPRVRDGQTAGSEGAGKRLEALMIDTSQLKYDVILDVKLHIQNVGWVEYKDVIPEMILGTIGKSQRIEAIELNMQGLPENKILKYQVHLANYGWTDWVTNGFTAGTVGISTQIEAIKIIIV